MSDHLTPIPWIDVLIILAMVTLNGVLAMSELAIVSSREARLKAMARSGSAGAKCALELAAEPGRLDQPITPAIELPELGNYVVRDALIHMATHNSHHLGQIVTLRQLMGLWPPRGGGWTW